MKQYLLLIAFCFLWHPYHSDAQDTKTEKFVLSAIVKVTRTATDVYSFQLDKVVKAKGYIKPNSPGLFTGTDWEVRFTDAEGKLLQSNKVNDPTHTTVECMNDEGRYQQVALSNDDGVLWLRVNYTDAIKYMVIYNGGQLLQKFQLQ